MLKHDRKTGAPGRRSSAWSLGLLAFGSVVIFGALYAGVATPQGAVELGSVDAGIGNDLAGLPFENAATSMDALGSDVVRALGRGDEAALERLRLTEHEHNDVVWPELPASAPEINYPVDYAWTNIENRNRRAVARNFETFGESSISAQGVECRGEIEEFQSFRVHTDCYVVFTRDRGLERWQSQLFKDVIERGGGYKIFRYYDAEPGPWRAPPPVVTP